jgi:hypothetical protein
LTASTVVSAALTASFRGGRWFESTAAHHLSRGGLEMRFGEGAKGYLGAGQGNGMKWNVSVEPVAVTLAQPGLLRPAAQLA